MILNTSNIKRYAIYVFYDKDGIADEYNFYLLNDLKKNVDRLMIICNGQINQEGLDRFQLIADEVMMRDNEGFDVTAYKCGLKEHGYDFLAQYDEVIVLNATNFGPFYPLEEMFDSMAAKDLDFWGITTFNEAPFDPFGTIEYGYIPKHIQSHFMVFRKKMHQSKDFQEYFDNFPEVRTYNEAVGIFETVFTKKFADKGYIWDAYVDEPELEGYTFSPHRDYAKWLIEERRCPILKRRSFFHEYREGLERSCGEATREAFDFIEQNLDYDTDMIWSNLLRLQNQADIKKRMHLNYILSSKKIEQPRKKIGKIGLIMHIYHTDWALSAVPYVNSIPQETDIYVTTPTEEKKKELEKTFENVNCNKLEIRVIENRGRDVSALLVGCKDIVMAYDLVCFMHDKKVMQIQPHTVGESWSYMCLENILKSKEFVANICNTFVDNPRLGLLTPPPPCHAIYYPTLGAMEWGPNFSCTKELAEKLKLHVNIDPEKEPVAPIGSFFWFRPKALFTLFAHDWHYDDFSPEPMEVNGTISHAIERIYPFVVQHEGYYCGHLMSDEFAKIELTNLDFIMESLKKPLFKKCGVQTHLSLVESIKNQ